MSIIKSNNKVLSEIFFIANSAKNDIEMIPFKGVVNFGCIKREMQNYWWVFKTTDEWG